MPRQIVVLLKKHDQIDKIISYLDLLAVPETEVVFLTSFPEQMSWMQVQLTTMQTGTLSLGEIKKLTSDVLRERQLRLIAERIQPVRAALQKRGLTVRVDSYTGSLRKAILSLRDPGSELVLLLRDHYTVFGIVFEYIQKYVAHLRSDDCTPMLTLRPRHLQ